MKCIISLTLLVAFSNAYVPYATQRELRVDDDRRISLIASRKMIIFNVPKDDPESIAIVVREQGLMKRIIRINKDKQITSQITLALEMRTKEASFENQDYHNETTDVNNQQMKVLLNIFKKYEGIVDEAKFYQLLKDVKQAVERLELNSIVYDVLRELEVSPVRRSDADEDTTTEANANLDQALQASLPIEWIQSLFESNLRKKKYGDSRNDQKPSSNENEIIMIQRNITGLQNEIMQHQHMAQQYQQLQFPLFDRKNQLTFYLQYQGLPRWQRQRLGDQMDLMQKEEKRLVERQLEIQQRILKLQESLISQLEKLREELKKDDDDNKEDKDDFAVDFI